MTATDSFARSRFGEHPLGRLGAALSVRQAGQGVEVGQPLDALGRGGVAQDVLEPARQQRPVDRLGDEVRGASLEGEADGFRVLMTGHHDDRDGGEARLGSQRAGTRRSHPCRASRRPAARWRRPAQVAASSAALPLSKPSARQAALGRRLHQQQPAEILIVGDDGDRLGSRIRAHAVARSFSCRSSSMSAGCAAAQQRRAAAARQRASPASAQPARAADLLRRIHERADVGGTGGELVADAPRRLEVAASASAACS